jgi:hypothetical protein
MKYALALVLALLGFTAQAQTYNLLPGGCTATCACFNVGTTEGPSWDYVSHSSAYSRGTASMDGILWDSGLGGAPNPAAFVMYDGLGHSMTASLVFTKGRILIRSGHNYWRQTCKLDAGLLTQ